MRQAASKDWLDWLALAKRLDAANQIGTRVLGQACPAGGLSRRIEPGTENASGVKHCSTCKELLPVSSFSKNKSTKDGMQTQCKSCQKVYWKQRKTQATKKECQWCGSSYEGNCSDRYCSSQCSNEAKKARDRCRRFKTNVNRKRPAKSFKNETHKLCGKCNTVLPLSEFFESKRSGYVAYCKSCLATYKRKARRRNGPLKRDIARDLKINKLAKKNAVQAWKYWLRVKAPDAWCSRYYAALGQPWRNPRISAAEQYRLKYANDPDFAIKERLRRQMNKKAKRDGIAETMRAAIRHGGKSPTVERLLGYSIAELKDHLERQFTSGMSWDTFLSGQIHIDHIVPQKEFDLQDEDEWRKCWCLSNLQPLWARDNLEKRDRRTRLL